METMTTALPFQDKQPIFMKLDGVSAYAHLSERERKLYDKSLDIYRDNYSVQEFERIEGREQGRAEGLAEGRAEGHAEAKRTIALNLKRMGLSTEQIQAATELSKEEIEAL